MLDHEVHGPRGGTDHRLPALHWQSSRSWNQADFFQLVAPIRYALGRQVVEFAVVRERAIIKRFEDDVDLIFEQLDRPTDGEPAARANSSRLRSLAIAVLGAPSTSHCREW